MAKEKEKRDKREIQGEQTTKATASDTFITIVDDQGNQQFVRQDVNINVGY